MLSSHFISPVSAYWRLVLFCALLLAGTAQSLFAQEPGTYYVSPQGSNNNPGTQAQPWQTIQFAVDLALPGDLILVNDGLYEGPVIMTRSGEPDAYITLKSINKWGAKVEVVNGEGDQDGIKAAANYLTIDGFELFDPDPQVGHHGNGVTVYKNHHINILNNKIYNFGGSGIQAVHFDHLLVENNVVYNNAKYNPNQTSGISLYQAVAVDDEPGYHAIIRNNRSFGNINLIPTNAGQTYDGNGILIDDFWNSTGEETNIIFPHRTLIENNLCYDNGGKGIQVYKSNYVDVYNNTAYHNNHDLQNTGTWRGELSLISSTGTVWRNNIGISNPGEGVLQTNSALFISKGGETVWENNLTYSSTPGDNGLHIDNSTVTESYLVANNVLGVDPLLVDAALLDFHLQPVSPAIDAGSDLIVSFTDINYQTRPQGAVDIGAFEFTESQLVEFSSFDAEVVDIDIQLTWTTATETNNSGFGVEIQTTGSEFEEVLFVESQGNSSGPQTYTATLAAIAPGTYTLRIKQVSSDGSFSYSETLEVTAEPVHTPVDITAFDAEVTVQGEVPVASILLSWTTATETYSAGFAIEVAESDDEYEQLLYIESKGPSSTPQDYAATLQGISPGTYVFRLRQIDIYDLFSYSDTLHVTVEEDPNLPVELISFDAVVSGSNIQLAWSTASELNNAGFAVELRAPERGFEQVQFIEGHGTTDEVQLYETVLTGVSPGVYTLRLKQIDFDGTFSYSSEIEVTLQADAYHLSQSYPNPFNPQTRIQYTLPVAGHATLRVFNLLGREIQTLVDAPQPAGTHSVVFDGSHLPNGTYVYRLTAGSYSETKTMVLLK